MDTTWIIEQKNILKKNTSEYYQSLFTLGNGYLGLRGCSSNINSSKNGTFINGFYEEGPITYGEKAFGFPENWQTIVSIPNGRVINISVNGTRLFGENGEFIKNKHFLDMKKSVTTWDFSWRDENNLTYSGILTTLIPFESTGSLIFNLEINLPMEDMDVSIESSLEYIPPNNTDEDDPRIASHFTGETISISKKDNCILMDTTGSNLTLLCDMTHRVLGLKKETNKRLDTSMGFLDTIRGQSSGKKISITKIISFSYGSSNDSYTTEANVKKELSELTIAGYDLILKKQLEFMNSFWRRSDTQIYGDDDAQKSLRFNLFQLLQSTGRDGKRLIAAKGLSGLGYEGHYFWDAEVYILPFFIYTNPQVARSMLIYRISTIPRARKRAELLGHNGILFPWRGINGNEASAYFPAGTAQYHINFDIALGLIKYMEASGDFTILDDGGEELLKETAEFWCSFGCDIKGKGFCFNSVTGPDEYTAIVDNNFYTNIGARENLLMAVKYLKGRVKDEYLLKWSSIADNIFLPNEIEITPQDDSFLSKEVWDFRNTEKSKYPLLLHFHPLNIYRKQVLKQADVVMAQVLNRKYFPPGLMARNFEYYEKITTRDSSLSACIQGICAFWLGNKTLPWKYFLETVHTDRLDTHNNVGQGLHTASMGGSYLFIIYGFLGLEHFNETIRLRPKLIKNLTGISLNILIKGKSLEILLEDNRITYKCNDDDMDFYHFSEKISLKKGEEMSLETAPRVKLKIEGMDNTSLYKLENIIYEEIIKNGVLSEETQLLPLTKDQENKYKNLGYF